MEETGWQKVTLTKDIESEGILRESFLALLVAAGMPDDAILYGNTSVEHPDDVFFSPGAVRISGALLRVYGGVACEPPDPSEISVLVRNGGNLTALEP
jgi:hypothetical protein